MESKTEEVRTQFKQNIMINYSIILKILFIIACIVVIGCEEEFNPPITAEVEQYVVEGYVEAGEGSNPTYVLITRSVPFFDELNADQFASLFVNNADVAVDDGDKVVQLNKFCLGDIPDGPLKDELAEQFGIDLTTVSEDVDLCVYLDLTDQLTREIGRTYDLTIRVDDDLLTASTTIPELVKLDSFEFEEIPGVAVDTLAHLFCRIADPEEVNYYRYFTDDDVGNLNTAFSSITDDVQFNGQDFRFPLSQADNDEVSFEDYGFFNVGDTVTIKWCTIDEAHYNFWNTFEYSLNGQGSPFTSYTRIADNVEGGFGIWGGYAIQVEELIVTKE